MKFLFLLLYLLTSCAKDAPPSSTTTHYIKGRDVDNQRIGIYRVKMPNTWIRRDPPPGESIADTTKSLVDFIIYEDGKTIRIAVHNFPTSSLEERIPAKAQVARWEKQFEILYPHDTEITPQCFNGFCGLLFEGSGLLHGEETSVMGWALLIATEHYRALSYPSTDKEKKIYPQMRADVTIKATGPNDLMNKHRESIIDFAHSFELISEIPTE